MSMTMTIFSKRGVVAAICLLIGTLVSAPRAQAQDTAEEFVAAANVESARLIEKCWAISEEDRASGNTPRMRRGGARSAGCLEEVILDLTERILDPDTLSRAEMRRRLDIISDNFQRTMWDVYTANKGCYCGTHTQVLHLSAYTEFLEGMIRRMVWVRVEHKL